MALQLAGYVGEMGRQHRDKVRWRRVSPTLYSSSVLLLLREDVFAVLWLWGGITFRRWDAMVSIFFRKASCCITRLLEHKWKHAKHAKHETCLMMHSPD
jgi:hypothetical protein